MPTPKISIEALAQLARFDFTPAEAKRYAEQLPKVVDYVSQLQAVTTEVVPAVALFRPMRPDQVVPSPAREQILAAAPEREGDFWKVKAVF